MAAAARADARSVIDDSLRPTLATELRLASDVLGAAGMDVHVDGTPAGLPADVDGIMASVLREAVTNVLRHSCARRVDVAIEADDRFALTVRNDGAGRPGLPGRGLANLQDRVRDAGGTFTAARDGEAFELQVQLPADRAVAAP